MVVYWDLFFLSNWVMDYLLLRATASFAGARAQAWRIALSAALGAGYATAFLFPGARPLFSMAAKAVFSLLMVAVAFPVRSPAHLGRLWLCFSVLSLAAGGGALALAYLGLPGPGGPLGGIPAWAVGVAVAATLALAARAWAYRRQHADLVVVPAEVSLGGRRVVFPALVDTGNRLRDPFSGAPVLVLEYGTARRLVPRELRPLLLGHWGGSGGGSGGAGAGGRRGTHPPGAGRPDLAERFCVVPYAALGRQRGVLYGFRPDRVRVQCAGGWRALGPVVVGVCPDVLSADGWYAGLLPGEALGRPHIAGLGGGDER